MQINTTEIAGVAAFGTAAVVTALAARRAGRSRGVLAGVAALYALLAVEVVVGLRHRLSQVTGRVMLRLGEYADRRTIQMLLIGVAIALVALIGWRAARRAERRLRPVLLVAAAVAALFVIEAISLHAIDHLLYRRIGGILVIGLLWLALGAAAVETAERTRGGAGRRR